MKKQLNLCQKIQYGSFLLQKIFPKISFSLFLGIFSYAPFVWSAASPYDFLNPVSNESLTYDDKFKASSPLQLNRESEMTDFINHTSVNLNVNTAFDRQTVDVNSQADNNNDYFSNQSLNHVSPDDSATLKWRLTDQFFGTGDNKSLAGFANTQFLSADILSSIPYDFDSSYQLNSKMHTGVTFLPQSTNSIGIDYSLMNSQSPNKTLSSVSDTESSNKTLSSFFDTELPNRVLSSFFDAASHYNFLNPVLSEALTYDDNVFKVSSPLQLGNESQMTDFIDRASANLNINNTFGRQIVDVNLQADNNYYFSNQALNHVSTDDRATLRWRLTDKLFGKIGTGFNRSLAGFSNTQFLSADILSIPSYNFDSSYQLNSNWRFDADWKGNQTMHSIASRNSQNTNSQTMHAGVTFLTSSTNSIGIDYSLTNTQFPNRTLSSFSDTEFQENFEKILLKYNYSPKLNFEAQAGYKSRNYQHSSELDFHGEAWHITATYSPTVRTALTLSGWHEPTSFTELASSYYASEGVTLSPSWLITEKIVLSGQVKMENQDHASNGLSSNEVLRSDQLYSAGLNTSYNINTFSKLGLAYQFAQRDSNRSRLYGYVDDTLTATVQFKL